MGSEHDKALQGIADRLLAIEERLDGLDRCLQHKAELRRNLAESEENRRQLADQAAHLLEQLSQTRNELRQFWDETKRNRAEGRN